MGTRIEPTDDTAAFLDHFKALPFDQKKAVLAACKADMDEAVKARLADIEAEKAELLALTGRPEASAPSHAGERKRRTGKTPSGKVYKSKKDSNLTCGTGGRPAAWLVEEMAEMNLPKEAFLVDAEA
ncbi:hypothetical protein [Methylorubrum sp. SB2]|uniref:hypothetical protein n=1 Tax=Methylorubrum subtropicum TaxID=3138812 RepID=UPI00313E9639